MKRRQARRNRFIRDEPVEENDLDAEGGAAVPADGAGIPVEEPLIKIIREAVESAFRECDSQDFLLLQLNHAHGLLGRELAQMFGCSEAKISRSLENARRMVVKSTMSYVRKQDPWLELKWEDFVELCRAVSPSCFGVE
jgi:DNA-directed RNA polymerase specialized sigma24 family protein